MTDPRPSRVALRYSAAVALAGALIAPGVALTVPTAFAADSKLPIGYGSNPAVAPSATPSVSASADPTADPQPSDPTSSAEPTQSAEPSKSAEPEPSDSAPANPGEAKATISTEKWREGKIVIRGEGFLSNAPGRGAVFAVKFLDARPDEAHQAINPLTKQGGNSPANFMAIAKEDGTFEVEVPLPTPENTGLSAEKLAEAGWGTEDSEHQVQLLAGSLGGADENGKNYDRGISLKKIIKLSEAGPEYKPIDAPEAITATSLTESNDVRVHREGATVTVTVPKVEPGTWVYAATYLGNSPQTLYGSGWKRLDENRSFSYETSVTMPPATYRVVVHNGNEGAQNTVLGFADMNVERAITPRNEISRDEQDASDTLVDELNSHPATTTSNAPAPLRNAGGRISTRATDVDATVASLAPSTTPVVNRVQAKAKVHQAQETAKTATGATKKTNDTKAPAKAVASASPAPSSQSSTATALAATKAQEPTIEGTELTGATKWFVNNANNLLLSAAGLVVLALALTVRRSAK